MHAEALTNRVTARDRLVTTVCFAVLLHGLIILGVRFTAGDSLRAPGKHTLEITLVNAPSDEAPEKADYLADASQRGGGNIDTPMRARSPDAQVGDPAATAADRDGPSRRPGEFADAADDDRPRAAALSDPVVTSTREGHTRVALAMRAGAGSAAPSAQGAPIQLPSIPADIAAHTALAYSSAPREVFINVNTQEVLYAAYIHRWRERVERVGNLNYPDEARRRGLSGSLELEVALGAAGTVHDLKVRRGSGNRVLDDAARKIVYMAVPFPPFPDELKREVDVLRFAFIWEFGDGVATSSVHALEPSR